MSKGGFVPYHLRPNKAVDRQLFIELLFRLQQYRDISKYVYVGFGGPTFDDFKLIHSYFANKKMISLEIDEVVWRRQSFNQPVSCIESLQISSGQFIDSYSLSANAIVWLDFPTARDTRTHIEEFQSLLPKLRNFDIVKITLNADVESLHSRYGMPVAELHA